MEKIRTFFRNQWTHILAFLIPSVVVCIGYIAIGITPFGDNSILTMDLWGQYFPMIVNVRDILFGGEGLFSFDGALGFNALAQSAYYTNSPIWALLALFPQSAAIYLVNYAVLLKFGLASLTMSVLLRKKVRLDGLPCAALSSAYALSTYMIAFLSQTMWHDAVVLLPLVVLAYDHMMSTRRPYAYILTLALTLWTNFYVGYMVCVFLVLYFFVHQISSAKTRRGFLNDACLFGIYSLISGGAAAVVLIPTYRAIGNTVASTLGWGGKLKTYHTLAEVLDSLFIGENVSLEFGVPNLYCSVFAVLLALIFLCNRSIERRTRVAYGIASGFLLLSMNVNLLDYLWHGFHYPNQLPGRESFLWCFVLLLMAAYSIRSLSSLTKLRYYIALGVTVVMLSCVLFGVKDLSVARTVGTLVLTIACFVLVFFYQKERLRPYLTTALSLLIVLEISVNAVFLIGNKVGNYPIPSYTHADKAMKQMKEYYSSDKHDFFRTEMIPHWTFEGGMLYDYNGLSYYSSTMSGDAYDFFRALGSAVYAQNVSTVYRQTPVLNTLLNVRYIVDRDTYNTSFGMLPTGIAGNYTVYENQYLLPIAFMAKGDAADVTLDPNDENFDNQSRFFEALTGYGDVYTLVEYDDDLIENAYILREEGDDYYVKNDPSADAVFTYRYTVKEQGCFYADCLFRYGAVRATVNGEVVWQNGNLGYQDIKCLGNLRVGDEIEITVRTANYYSTYGVNLYAFNVEPFIRGYLSLVDEPLTDYTVTPGHVKGKIHAEEDGLLYTSIPNDGGWKAKVDGKEVEVRKVADYLCGVSVGAGDHTVEFTYSPPGLDTGIATMIASAVLLVLSVFVRTHKKKD